MRAIQRRAFVALVCACALGAGGAQGECRSLNIGAVGQAKEAIGEATSSAVDALVGKIAKTYGAQWSTGSHRTASFDCHKDLGGNGSHPARWACTALTGEICKVGG